jgi:hypothetical protein
MSRALPLTLVTFLLALGVPVFAEEPDPTAIRNLAHCQKAIAREGAKFAMRVIKSTLKCTEEVNTCQVECDEGVFGPPCDDTNPPGCCDPDTSNDQGSPNFNLGFADCMLLAQGVCDSETNKRAIFETSKQNSIVSACGASTSGLSFITLNAGCQALDPNYTCSLTGLVNCVGGPLERALLDQISATLSPRASDAVAALNLEAEFPDIPVTRKVKGTVPAGKADVYSFSGQAGDNIVARVNTRDDTGANTSLLHAELLLLDAGMNPVASTHYRNGNCGADPVCGAKCPIFKRSLPFDGQFFLAVAGVTDGGCTGVGGYKLILISPGGATPVLVADDVTPP